MENQHEIHLFLIIQIIYNSKILYYFFTLCDRYIGTNGVPSETSFQDAFTESQKSEFPQNLGRFGAT